MCHSYSRIKGPTVIPDSLCPLPWLSLETSPNGSFKPCCVYREQIPQAHAGTHTIAQVQHSEYMQNLREQFIQGQRPEACGSCWAEENSGKVSKRQYSIIKFQKHVNDLKVKPLFLDLKLGNVCNIKCRICGSWSSSAWAPEEQKLFANSRAFEMVRAGQWPNDSELFWQGLDQVLPQVEYFEFTGGEPFYIKNHFKILQQSVDQGHSHRQSIHYNTNGTIFPRDAVDNIWPHFKHVEIAFSIDDLAERFEYQRHPARWGSVVANIKEFHKLREQASWLTTQVCITVSLFNILNLPQILNWAEEQKFDMVHLNYLHGPEDFCLHQLPENFKQRVLYMYKCVPFHQKRLDPVINFMMSQQSQWPNSERLKKLAYHDEYRSESFAQTFPQEWQLLNETR